MGWGSMQGLLIQATCGVLGFSKRSAVPITTRPETDS